MPNHQKAGVTNVKIITLFIEGWVILDVVDMVRKWLKYNQRRHTIQVMCETCGFTAPWTPVSIETKNRPFLEINTETNRKVNGNISQQISSDLKIIINFFLQ